VEADLTCRAFVHSFSLPETLPCSSLIHLLDAEGTICFTANSQRRFASWRPAFAGGLVATQAAGVIQRPAWYKKRFPATPEIGSGETVTTSLAGLDSFLALP
jgi:hypothetical protein